MAALVLGPSETYNITEKWGGKWGTIHLGDIRNLEMVIIFLTKMITAYVRFSQICFQSSSFKWALSRLCLYLSLSLHWFYKYFHEFCKKIFGKKNKRWNISIRSSKILKKSRSLVASYVEFFCWALAADKLIWFFGDVNLRIDAKTLSNTRY